MIIYKIKNKVNGKIYIGQTIRNLNKRIGFHLIAKSLVGNALRKYALQCFDVSVIDFADTKAMLDEKEKEYIRLYNCKAPNGYNLTDGGDGITGAIGIKHSEEWNRKISNSLMGHSFSEKTKEKWRINKRCVGRVPWNKGVPWSDEVKAKISKANLGKLSWMKGKKHSEESKEKNRQSHLGRPSAKKGRTFTKKIEEKTT